MVPAQKREDEVELKLQKADSKPFAAVLVDNDNKPVGGASVWVEMLADLLGATRRSVMSPGSDTRWVWVVFTSTTAATSSVAARWSPFSAQRPTTMGRLLSPLSSPTHG